MSRSTKGQIRLERMDYVTPVQGGYHAIHKWMNRHFLRTGRCEWCGGTRTRTGYALARHDRYTRNRADWFELCGRCHTAFDGFTGTKGRRKQLRSAEYEVGKNGSEYKRGADHASWKGSRAGAKGIHQWMKKTYPLKGRCEGCERTDKPTMYASIDHTYTRDPQDWLELCMACHRAFDGHGAKVRAKKLTDQPEKNVRRGQERAARREAEKRYWIQRLRELRPERFYEQGEEPQGAKGGDAL